MIQSIPKIGGPLSEEHLSFLSVLSKSARSAIVQMVTNAQSGHPGGSCSVIDYLSLIYAFIVSQSGDDVVVSNGHVSPAVYSILAEMGYIPRQEVIDGFRKIGKIYEGHITRHVAGVHYGTGPLGVGVSAASGMALAESLKGSDKKVFALVGDGEAQEGQVYEMMHFVNKYKLNNYILFVDYNAVQLSDSLEKVMPTDVKSIFESGGWNVIEVDGHDFGAMWEALGKAYASDKPMVFIGKTVMGKGVSFMEGDGQEHKATWHGIAPKPEQAEEAVANELAVSSEEQAMLDEFRSKLVTWNPKDPHEYDIEALTPMKEVKVGSPRVLEAGTTADCRGAYGNALLDLAKENENVVAMTADLGGSVKTAVMGKEFPERHIEVGIAEQHMVSCAGGMSLSGFVPFCSTFGAFMTSRAKDQARVNDINRCNVKMVSTHCGLSVGEDGPTHQAIDDMGSMVGLLNTMVIEPADANQCDRIIRFVASHYGNFYVRMGRHKFPVLTKSDGSVFYDESYEYEYGKADLVREGSGVTVVASGALVGIAAEIADSMNGEVEVIAVSTLKKLDLDTILSSLEKTGRLITIEDHNPMSGLGSAVNSIVAQEGLNVLINNMGVREYQLSGKWNELYESAGIGKPNLENAIKAMLTSE